MAILRFLVFMLCVSFNLCSTVINIQDDKTFKLDEHSTNIGNDFNAFKNWMLAKKPPDQKQVLIKNTVLAVHYPQTPSVDWAKARMSDQTFDQLIESHVNNISLVVTAIPQVYNYFPNHAFWVDFSNASTFGGGFRSKGNVQEERMFMEFPQLDQLAFAKKSNQILPVSKNCKLPRESPSCAEPFLVFRILRRFDISNVPVGKALYTISTHQVIQDIQKLSKPYPIANIIGLAASDRCAKGLEGKSYSLLDLKYLLKEAFLGNLGALKFNLQKGRGTPDVHTGNWGTGAFKNSDSMMTAIQILAGAMSQMQADGTIYGIHLFFHLTPANLVSQIQQDVISRLQQGQTPLNLLNYFLSLQAAQPNVWGPKPCN